MSFTNEEYMTELEKRFSELPDAADRSPKEWTPELDALLLKYWPIKRQNDVAKVLQRGIPLCKRRYEELTKKDN